jgi:hypothetical protein
MGYEEGAQPFHDRRADDVGVDVAGVGEQDEVVEML